MRSRWNTLTVLAMVGTFGGCNSKSIWQAAYAGDQDTVNSILFWDKFFKTDKVNQIDEARQWTPLHYAINNSYGDMAVLLLDKGADPRIVSGDGRTARQFAEQVSNDLMRNFILSRVDDVLANCEFMASINAEARGTAEAKAQIAQARAKAADVRAQAAERAAADARTEAEEAIVRGEDAEAQLGVLQITSDAESTFDTESQIAEGTDSQAEATEEIATALPK